MENIEKEEDSNNIFAKKKTNTDFLSHSYKCVNSGASDKKGNPKNLGQVLRQLHGFNVLTLRPPTKGAESAGAHIIRQKKTVPAFKSLYS